MTFHPLCCEEWISLGGIESVLRFIKKSQRVGTVQILLKVARNLSRWTRSVQLNLEKALEMQDVEPLIGTVKDPEAFVHSIYWEHHFWDAHVHSLMEDTLACDNEDLLLELLGIMNNFTHDDLPASTQWQDKLDGSAKDLVVGMLNKLRYHDDIKLEFTMWLGALCHSKDCCTWLASTGVLDVIHRIFIDRHDPEMRLQILLVYERCLLFEMTRFHIVAENGVMDAMLDCLAGENSLRFAAETCLMLIEEFHCNHDGVPGKIGSSIKQKRFEHFYPKQDGSDALTLVEDRKG
jgi:hypothetical protein